MNNAGEKKVDMFDQILVLLEKGKFKAEILKEFPGQENEVEEILLIIKSLKRESREVQPSKDLLRRLIEKMPDSAVDVTNGNLNRYQYPEAGRLIKGRASIWISFENLITKTNIMNKKLKIALPVVAIVILVGAFALFGGKEKTGTVSLENSGEEKIFEVTDSKNVTKDQLSAATKEPETLDEEIDEVIDSILSEDTELNEDDNIALAELNISELDEIYDASVSVE